MKQIAFWILGCTFLLLGGTRVGANSPEQGTALISASITNFNTQLGKLRTTPDSKANIIHGFCQTLTPESTTGFSNSHEIYEASQSIFLYLLCNNHGIQTDFFYSQLSEYLKTSSFQELKVDHSCRKGYEEECNVVDLSDWIMSQLFSELFSLKQAERFGLSQENISEKSILLKKINSFAEEHFGIINFCTNPDLNYPQTCKNMQKNIKTFGNQITKFKILNSSKLYSLVKDKKTNEPLDACKKQNNYDLLLCGTLGETTNGLNPFINLLYNELARYTIFMTYYTNILSMRNEINYSTRDEIAQYSEDSVKFFQLTNQTLDDLLVLSRSYPIHIGLLAYQEDLLRLRNKSLSKIVTPFYTLYHKLRNVQTDQ